jgi:hypothetical protein
MRKKKPRSKCGATVPFSRRSAKSVSKKKYKKALFCCRCDSCSKEMTQEAVSKLVSSYQPLVEALQVTEYAHA